jgi:hypothetical protein
MKTTHASVAISFLFSGCFAAAAAAQSYGPEDQVLTIGAGAFRNEWFEGANIDAGGYLRGGYGNFNLAPLPLPEGALIERLCLYADDSDPSEYVRSHVVAIKQVPGGEGPALKVVGPDVFSTDEGYHRVCEDGSVTLRGRMDVDGDGTLDAVAHYVHLEVPYSETSPLGAGGVQITWKRQVSASPPTPTFGDVPPSDSGFPHIEALAASGITAGCAGGNFCPNATLTRRQMAVFLSKALGLHWAD